MKEQRQRAACPHLTSQHKSRADLRQMLCDTRSVVVSALIAGAAVGAGDLVLAGIDSGRVAAAHHEGSEI